MERSCRTRNTIVTRNTFDTLIRRSPPAEGVTVATVTDVSAADLTALKELALLGATAEPVTVSCSDLGERLDASGQTASRRLRGLEDADLVDRDVGATGQRVRVTERGTALLRGEYADYRRLFEDDPSLTLDGTVTDGMGEGRHYISLSGYMRQFRERLGYEPYPGTLNADLDGRSRRSRAELTGFDAVPIDGWTDEDRTFGPATCYPATVAASGETYGDAHVIVPERTHHDEGQIELIAPDRLRDELGLEDGDAVAVTVVDTGRADSRSAAGAERASAERGDR